MKTFLTSLLSPSLTRTMVAEKEDGRESIARNRRARHDYQILDTWEAGIVLTGSEVKSLRNGKANISDAYGIVKEGEVYLLNLHVSPYEQASYFNHEPTRTRKLLLHRREIKKMKARMWHCPANLGTNQCAYRYGVSRPPQVVLMCVSI